MYVQHCIVDNCVSTNFMSFSILACLTKRLFSNSSKIPFYLDAAYYSWASALLFVYLSIEKQISNEHVIWTCFRCFLYCLPLSLFAAKGADSENACIGSAKSFYIRGVFAINTCARGTYVGNAFFAIDAYIKSAGHDGTDTKGADRKSAYAKSACIVKHSRIHLQSFSISEIELFGTGW